MSGCFILNQTTDKIPKIIIQTWKTREIGGIIGDLISKLRANNPDFEYKFFTDEDIDHFIKTEYPQYYNIYNAFEYTIQKIDFFRYLCVYHYGGFYFDIDMDIDKSITPLCEYECVFPKESNLENDIMDFKNQGLSIVIGNYAFGASTKNKFLKLCIDNITSGRIKPSDIPNNDDRYKPYVPNTISQMMKLDSYMNHILYTTGPVLVSQSYIDYKDKNAIEIIEPNVYRIYAFGDYGSHKAIGTWKTMEHIDTKPKIEQPEIEQSKIEQSDIEQSKIEQPEIEQSDIEQSNHIMNINFVINNNGDHKSIVKEGGGATEVLSYLLAEELSHSYNVKIFNLLQPREKPNKIDNIQYQYLPTDLEVEARNVNNAIFIIIDKLDFAIGLHSINKNNKYMLWCHNYLEQDCQKYMNVKFDLSFVNEYYSKNNIPFVVCSDFHKKNILSLFPDTNVIRIYNSLYPHLFPRKNIQYDKNKIILASRWSKGLDNVIKISIQYYLQNKDFKLVLIKPKYCPWDPDLSSFPFIEKIGNITDKTQYSELLQGCLAVLSTSFEETFGCVFEEALHLGVPVIGDNSVDSGTLEIVPSEHICNFNNTSEVIEMIEQFRENRPEVQLDKKFYSDTILQEWKDLFSQYFSSLD